jgi:hypothetical protein
MADGALWPKETEQTRWDLSILAGITGEIREKA